jgi:hypothetical protein
MPQALTLSTPPQGSIKRQRSEELPSANVANSISAGRAPSEVSPDRLDESANLVHVRIPPYLNKSKASKYQVTVCPVHFPELVD